MAEETRTEGAGLQGDEAEEGASARGARVTAALVEAAGRYGLRAVKEYAIPGGRLDVVWLWDSPIPGADGELPIVAFEVESSWRHRKYIKGDLVNLQDAAPLVGVIVLLGDGPDVEGTRRFASRLVDRPGSRIVVWSEEDVRQLVSGVVEWPQSAEPSSHSPAVASSGAGLSSGGGRSTADHWGKYRPLYLWLQAQDQPTVTATFGQVEEILGFSLPPSSRRHIQHWYGYSGTAVGRAIRDAGWQARRVNLESETVDFEREMANGG